VAWDVVTVDLAKLRETAPRSFVIIWELSDDDGPDDLAVIGWGLETTYRTIFAWSDAWTGDRPSIGLFSSAERVLGMVELIGPAQLVWMDSTEPG